MKKCWLFYEKKKKRHFAGFFFFFGDLCLKYSVLPVPLQEQKPQCCPATQQKLSPEHPSTAAAMSRAPCRSIGTGCGGHLLAGFAPTVPGSPSLPLAAVFPLAGKPGVLLPRDTETWRGESCPEIRCSTQITAGYMISLF